MALSLSGAARRWLRGSKPLCWPPRRRLHAWAPKQGSPATFNAYMQKTLDDYYRSVKCYENRHEAPPVFPQSDASKLFVLNELKLTDCNVMGFDYDFTLAPYNEALLEKIYDFSREALVNEFDYPRQMLSDDFQFDVNFAVRGLHFDTDRGLLMKVGQNRTLQIDTVHRGLQPVDRDEVMQIYNGRFLPWHFLADSTVQLWDRFSLVQASLLANIIQGFINTGVKFDNAYVLKDVRECLSHGHRRMHEEVIKNPGKYIVKPTKLEALLTNLKDRNKEIFMLTNSHYQFVDAGMTYILGDKWRRFFDYVLVDAKKPSFFSTKRRFRRPRSWQYVDLFRKGSVYSGGNVDDLHRLAGWKGRSIVYCGDHLHADLESPVLHHGWRTVAIVSELEREVEIQNTVGYRSAVAHLMNIERVMKKFEEAPWPSEDDRTHFMATDQKMFIEQRRKMRMVLKHHFNHNFGSAFRTHQTGSAFSGRLAECCDVYTSSVENLLNVHHDEAMRPARVFLPHEEAIRRRQSTNDFHGGM